MENEELVGLDVGETQQPADVEEIKQVQPTQQNRLAEGRVVTRFEVDPGIFQLEF